MSYLEQEIRRRYLDQLEDWPCDDEDPRLDFGAEALPYFIAAFEKEMIPHCRARLVRVIWQFRELAALPTLAIALRDPSSDVWKDALDGIVTLGGKQALIILHDARAEAATQTNETKKLDWIDEAAGQVADGIRLAASNEER